MLNKKELGSIGEKLAVSFLEAKGYRILERNFKSKIGEVDIVAQDKDTVCFIEVKARTTDDFGKAIEAVSTTKQRRLAKVALFYLRKNNLEDVGVRFDVVAIDFDEEDPKIEIIKNAFEVENF